MRFLAVAIAALFALPSIVFAQAASVTGPTPPPQNGLICVGGFVYSYSGTVNGVSSYLFGGSTCGGTTNTSGVYQHALHPVVDGPNSLQYTSAKEALDLASIDVEGDARFSDQSDADTVGGALSYFDAPGTDGEKLEGRYERNWRPFEGQRTRGLLNVPVDAIVDNRTGQAAVGALASGGLEFQAAPGWSVTPRAAVGAATGDSFLGGDGVLGSLSLGSRYRLPQVGRGDLVIGNMVAVTADSRSHNEDFMLRNGAAYQFPIKQLFFGRQMSARISYVNTYVGGDGIGIHDYHELAVNFGVRLREQDARNRFELLRFGILYTHADKYDAATLTLGYRF